LFVPLAIHAGASLLVVFIRWTVCGACSPVSLREVSEWLMSDLMVSELRVELLSFIPPSFIHKADLVYNFLPDPSLLLESITSKGKVCGVKAS
jgi:hypothetical protein